MSGARHLIGLSGGAIGKLRSFLADVGSLTIADFDKALDDFATKRLELAEAFLTFAETIAEDDGIGSRNAISRCYYSMHHSGRAVVFAVTRTDATQHDKVWRQLPEDLPGVGEHKRRLKFWHDQREEADYSPHVEPGLSLRELQLLAKREAREFLDTCRSYLKLRGVVG